MNIYGKKVYLRAMEPTDMEIFRQMTNDPDTEKMLGGWSFPVSEKEQMQWYDKAIADKKNLRFTVVLKDNQEVIGMVNLVDIDWKNGSAFHGIRLNSQKRNGYGTDAVMSLMKYAFEELRLVRIDTTIVENNIPSQGLYKKCGWTIEGKKKKACYKDGRFWDNYVMGITDDEYYEVKKNLGY